MPGPRPVVRYVSASEHRPGATRRPWGGAASVRATCHHAVAGSVAVPHAAAERRFTLPRMQRLAVACAFGMMFVFLGCGDDDGSASTTLEPVGREVERDDSTTEEERASDQQTAQDAVLTLEDLPPGWEASTDEEQDDNADDLEAGLAACLSVDRTFFESDNPQAESPTFVSAQGEQVQSEVTLTDSVSNATEVLDVLARDETPACYASAVESLLEEAPLDDVDIRDVTFDRLSFATVGDDVAAFRSTIALSAQGIDVDLFVDFVAVRVGRAGITMTFQSQGAPFPVDEAERLTRVVVDRVSQALD
jgi:hypothetical protein